MAKKNYRNSFIKKDCPKHSYKSLQAWKTTISKKIRLRFEPFTITKMEKAMTASTTNNGSTWGSDITSDAAPRLTILTCHVFMANRRVDG